MASRRANGEGSKPRQRKDGRWTAKVTWRDELGASHTTQVYGKTAGQVRAKMKEITRRLDDSRPATDAKIPLDTYVSTWIKTTLAASDRKPSTKQGYETLARLHVAGSTILGPRTLDQIRPSTIESWIVELREKGLSQSSVRQVYTIGRLILETAVRDQLLAKNPCAAVDRPKVERHEAEYLNPDQVKALRKAAADSRYGLLFEFLVQTGLRRGEALALRWRDVKLDEQRATVRGTLSRIDGDLTVSGPKTKSSRRSIDLSEPAVAVLKELKARTRQERLAAGTKWHGSEHIFLTEFGRPVEPRNALRALKVATEEAGIHGLEGEVGLHTLRHTAAALMLMSGVPMLVVSRHLGHTSISTTVDLYGHVAPDSSRQAVEALAGALA